MSEVPIKTEYFGILIRGNCVLISDGTPVIFTEVVRGFLQHLHVHQDSTPIRP
jgi:hypothetical protein